MRQLPVFTGPPALAYDLVGPADLERGSCRRCGLNDGVRTVCMPAEVTGGQTGPTLLVVGQGPGETEDRSGRPLVGPTGSYFRQLISKLWPGPVVLDNALRCMPGTRKMTPQMTDACRPFGVRVFQDSKPERILALGGEAIRSIVGESYPPLSVRKGYAHTQGGTPVFFLLHPVLGLRNRFARAWFEEDLEWALKAQPTGLPMNAVALMVTNRAEAERAADDLRAAEWVTWDIETFGAPFNREFAVLNLALTPYGCDYAYVLERQAIENQYVFAPIRAVLEDRRVKKCGQGLKFDLVGMRAKFGLRSYCDLDTELCRRLYNADAEANLEVMQCSIGMAGGKAEALGQVALGVKELQRLAKHKRKPPKKPKPVAPLAWSVTPGELEAGLGRILLGDDNYKRYAYAAIEPDVRSRYNGGDTISTDRLFRDVQSKHAERPDVALVWEKVGKKFAHAITEMEFNGVYASREEVRALQAMCNDKLKSLEGVFTQYGKDFNPNSHPQVGKLLFGELGITPKVFTDSGAPSTAEDVLEGIKHPVCKQILEFRRAVHFKSQYADGMEFYIQDDGRIHPSYKINGTGTGRPSCSDPNLFNIPRTRNENPFLAAAGQLCRAIFQVPPGKLLLEADYSQQELRVAAMLSGDQVMADIFRSGEDFHLKTAKMIAPILGLDPSVITKEHSLRDQAKIVNFSIAYGKGAKQLAEDLTVESLKNGGRPVSEAKAQAILDAIIGKFRGFQAWRQEQVRSVHKLGYCRTWWDGEPFRVRPLWHIADGDEGLRGTAERGSYNTPVQGTAAEFMNASLGAVQEWLEADHVPAKLVLTVYDSMMLEVDAGYEAEVAYSVKRIMESWNSLDVPLVAELKLGRVWGALEDYQVAA